jgi:sulfate adenylyltransferase subunit 2
MNARNDSLLLQADTTASPTRLSNAHLDALEEEAIFILREVAAAFERPVLLFSGGKDSLVLLKCAEKAFVDTGAPTLPSSSGSLPPEGAGLARGGPSQRPRGGSIPYPLLMIDTGHNFPEVTDFRDYRAKQLGADLMVRNVEDSMKRGTVAGARRRVAQCAPVRDAAGGD